jgi:hypothetical protein
MASTTLGVKFLLQPIMNIDWTWALTELEVDKLGVAKIGLEISSLFIQKN